MKIRVLAALLPLAVLVSACSHSPGPKEAVGTLGGAAVGGAVGSHFGTGGAAAGVVIGALLGALIGNQLDDADEIKQERAMALAETAPVGHTIVWNNPDTGNSGSVTPTRDGTSTGGEYCREFQQTVTIGGETEEAYGIACQRPDGSWEMRE